MRAHIYVVCMCVYIYMYVCICGFVYVHLSICLSTCLSQRRCSGAPADGAPSSRSDSGRFMKVKQKPGINVRPVRECRNLTQILFVSRRFRSQDPIVLRIGNQGCLNQVPTLWSSQGRVGRHRKVVGLGVLSSKSLPRSQTSKKQSPSDQLLRSRALSLDCWMHIS